MPSQSVEQQQVVKPENPIDFRENLDRLKEAEKTATTKLLSDSQGPSPSAPANRIDIYGFPTVIVQKPEVTLKAGNHPNDSSGGASPSTQNPWALAASEAYPLLGAKAPQTSTDGLFKASLPTDSKATDTMYCKAEAKPEVKTENINENGKTKLKHLPGAVMERGAEIEKLVRPVPKQRGKNAGTPGDYSVSVTEEKRKQTGPLGAVKENATYSVTTRGPDLADDEKYTLDPKRNKTDAKTGEQYQIVSTSRGKVRINMGNGRIQELVPDEAKSPIKLVFGDEKPISKTPGSHRIEI